MPAPLLEILRDQHHRTGGTAWVFPAKGDPTSHRDDCNADVRRACLRAGIKPVGLHALRHTCFTTMATAGVPATSIQGAAGHSALSVSMRYMLAAQASGNVAPLALANAFTTEAHKPVAASIVELHPDSTAAAAES
jgi:integrase